VLHRLTSAVTLIQRTTTEAPRLHMYYIGLDVHKKTISHCVKDVSGRIQQEGKVGSTRRELDCWMKALPQPWSVGMDATIISSIGRPEHLTLFELGIAKKVEFAFADPQSLHVSPLLEDGKLDIGTVHTCVELYTTLAGHLVQGLDQARHRVQRRDASLPQRCFDSDEVFRSWKT
jgi:Malonate decarboxylase, alpha subunit, transporter